MYRQSAACDSDRSGRNRFVSFTNPLDRRQQCRQLRGQLDGSFREGFDAVFSFAGIEDSQIGDSGTHHRHGVRIAGHGLQPFQNRLGDLAILFEACREFHQLTARGKFSVQQQITCFLKGTVRGQFIDVIAAIDQQTRFPIDMGNAALGGDDVF